jgi:hypothetical protein
MWVFNSSNGAVAQNGEIRAVGYSGNGEGKNNPAMESTHDVGPIPRGYYVIGPMIGSTREHGPDVLPLMPESSTDTFGRGGFLIHGDSLEHPGLASKGCIILGRTMRNVIAESGDETLAVV